MKNILLTSEKFVKETLTISDNMSGAYLGPAIREAQEFELQPILGQALYEKLKELVDSKEIDDEFHKAYKSLLGIAQYHIAYATGAKIVMLTSIKIGNIGAAQMTDENVNPLSMDELFRLQDYLTNKTDFYAKRLQEYLLANVAFFPEINANGCNQVHAELTSAASSGLFLGGARGKRVGKHCERIYSGGSGSGSGGGMTPQEVQALIDRALAVYWNSGVTSEHISQAVAETKTWVEAKGYVNTEGASGIVDAKIAAYDTEIKQWVEAKDYTDSEDVQRLISDALEGYYTSGETDSAISTAIDAQEFKTINGSGITGSGNIEIEGGKEINYQIVENLEELEDAPDGAKAVVKNGTFNGYSADFTNTSGWNTVNALGSGMCFIFDRQESGINIAYFGGWISPLLDDGEWHKIDDKAYYKVSGFTAAFAVNAPLSEISLSYQEGAVAEPVEYPVVYPKSYIKINGEWVNREQFIDFTSWNATKAADFLALVNGIPDGMINDFHWTAKLGPVGKDSYTFFYGNIAFKSIQPTEILMFVIGAEKSNNGETNPLFYCTLRVNNSGNRDEEYGHIEPDVEFKIDGSHNLGLTRHSQRGLAPLFIRRGLENSSLNPKVWANDGNYLISDVRFNKQNAHLFASYSSGGTIYSGEWQINVEGNVATLISWKEEAPAYQIVSNESSVIGTPTEGMLIFDLASSSIKVYRNNAWEDIFGNVETALSQI